MPVIKIFYSETLDAAVREQNETIQAGLEHMMREVLQADPAKCQVVFSCSTFVTPLPVYVDMQFRANEYRQGAVIETAMDKIVDVVGKALSTGIRIRAFAIDQSTLYARDVD
ncbi:hypothetical protein B6N13_05500 [Marinomonas sp. UCMA 3892]|jgi:hypothetical protein|uniref:DUF1904 domain-containing protein n=1 Tax=Marinomonas sp. (strain MWYL1) TaxID=400668 RepID=A6VRY2_MARMS|nr:hypothetical protein [Marinomonas sp. UCMA 3892]NLU97558.1 hypothetical protein [Marinomonas sp. UCMA 3892]